MIYGNSIGTEIDRTFIIQDANGNELVATVVDKTVVFDATPNDIRLGKTAATQNGVVTGEKEIPSYYVTEGYRVITNGSTCLVHLKNYEYTKLQAIFCPFNSSISGSVSAEKVAIDNNVYSVQSTSPEASVAVDTVNKCVNFGITNTSGGIILIRYFTYKEIY